MKQLAIFFILLVGSLTACSARPSSASCVAIDMATGQKSLTLPAVPTGVDSVSFTAIHYWDNADFTDTAFVDDEEMVKREFSRFVTLLQKLDDISTRRQAMSTFARRAASGSGFSTMLIAAQEVLYDPESPERNEELLAYFLDTAMTLDNIEPTDSDMMGYLSTNVNNNRAGTPVAPLELTATDGSATTLHDVVKNAPLSIVEFYDPTCGTCTTLRDEITGNAEVARLMGNRQLQLVAIDAVSAGDQIAGQPGKFPSPWHDYVARDDMMESTTFLLSSIPSLFLIDRDGTVILKVPTLLTLSSYLAAVE